MSRLKLGGRRLAALRQPITGIVWSRCFASTFTFNRVLMNLFGLNDLVMTRIWYEVRTPVTLTFLRARLLAGGFATRFSVAECKAMERSSLVLFEGILCSLPLVGCDGAVDALKLCQRPYSVHLVCYTSICAETGVKSVCPDLPGFLSDVPGNLCRIEDWVIQLSFMLAEALPQRVSQGTIQSVRPASAGRSRH